MQIIDIWQYNFNFIVKKHLWIDFIDFYILGIDEEKKLLYDLVTVHLFANIKLGNFYPKEKC